MATRTIEEILCTEQPLTQENRIELIEARRESIAEYLGWIRNEQLHKVHPFQLPALQSEEHLDRTIGQDSPQLIADERFGLSTKGIYGFLGNPQVSTPSAENRRVCTGITTGWGLTNKNDVVRIRVHFADDPTIGNPIRRTKPSEHRPERVARQVEIECVSFAAIVTEDSIDPMEIWETLGRAIRYTLEDLKRAMEYARNRDDTREEQDQLLRAHETAIEARTDRAAAAREATAIEMAQRAVTESPTPAAQVALVQALLAGKPDHMRPRATDLLIALEALMVAPVPESAYVHMTQHQVWQKLLECLPGIPVEQQEALRTACRSIIVRDAVA